MHWWNRSKTNNKTAIKTATIPVLAALVFSLLIIYSEYKLNQHSNKVNSIAIFSIQSDEESTELDDIASLETDKKIIDLAVKAKAYILQNGFQDTFTTQFFEPLSLTLKQQIAVLAQVAKNLYTNKYYAITAQIIDTLKPQQRLNHNLLFIQAQSKSELGDRPQALRIYKNLIQLQPNNQSALINYSLLLNKTQQFETAVINFKKAIAITNSNKKAKAYAGLGAAFFELKKYSQSVAALKKSIEYRPQHAPTWKKLARSLNLVNEKPEIISDTFDKAISLARQDYRLQFEYGMFLLSRLDFKRATTHLLIAKKLAKNNIEIRLGLALSYLERNKLKDARKHLLWIVKRKKNSKTKQLAEALVSYSKKNYTVSNQKLQSISKNQNNLKTIGYYQARIFSLTKQYDLAIQQFRDLEPDQQWKHLAEYRLSRIQALQQHYQVSLQLTEKLLTTSLNRESLYYQQSNLLRQLGRKTDALLAIQKAHKIAPKSSRVTLRLAQILHINKQSVEAARLLEQLLSRKPNYTRGLETLAKISLDLGNVETAISHYQTAIINQPEDTGLKYQLATILVTQKQYSQAEILLSELLLQNTTSHRARLLLAKTKFLNKDYPQALIEINLALKLTPNDNQAIRLKKTILEKL